MKPTYRFQAADDCGANEDAVTHARDQILQALTNLSFEIESKQDIANGAMQALARKMQNDECPTDAFMCFAMAGWEIAREGRAR